MFNSISRKILIGLTIVTIILILGVRMQCKRYQQVYYKQQILSVLLQFEADCSEISYMVASAEATIIDYATFASFMTYKTDNNKLCQKIGRWLEYEAPTTSDEIIAGIGFWLLPEKVDKAPHREMLYYSTINRKFYNYHDMVTQFDPNYDYINRRWYRDILPSILKTKAKDMQAFTSSSYKEVTIKKDEYIFSIGSGVYRRNSTDNNVLELCGMMTLDIRLSGIADELTDLQPTEHTSIFVYSEDDRKPIDSVLRDDTIKMEYELHNKELRYFLDRRKAGMQIEDASCVNAEARRIMLGKNNDEPYIICPLRLGSEFSVLFIVPENDLIGEAIAFTNSLTYSLLALMVIATILELIITRFCVLKPLSHLMEGVAQLGKGDINIQFDETRKDEMGQLGHAFNSMEKGLQNYIDRLQDETRERERISGELDMAANIQISMLPRTFPAFPECESIDIFASMDPAREVGGDFYDFCMPDKAHLYFVIADVSGKGIPAALFVMCARTIMRNTILNGIYSPAEILRQTNKTLCLNNDTCMFVTALMGCLDTTTGKLTLANAGHNPPLWKHNGKSQYVKLPAGFVLAAFDRTTYRDMEFQLAPGDIFYCYTDGTTEAQNADGALFGDKRLQENIDSSTPDNDAKTIINSIDEKLARFVNGAEQADDITQLCFRYLKQQG